MKSPVGPLAAVLMLIAVPTFAQESTTTATTTAPTLSDLAKRAQEKKASQPATKTFTNSDLKSVAAPSASDDSSKSADGKSADAKAAKADAKSGDAKSGDAAKGDDAAKADGAKKDDPANGDPTKTEKYWRERMNAAREDVRRNQAFAAALQSRINALSADFSARDDPYQRAQIADDRQKALAELDRVNKAIEEGNKAIAQVEEDARKAMVPAGWIR